MTASNLNAGRPGAGGFRAGVLLLAAQFPGQSHGQVLDTVVEAAVADESIARLGAEVLPAVRQRAAALAISPTACSPRSVTKAVGSLIAA